MFEEIKKGIYRNDNRIVYSDKNECTAIFKGELSADANKNIGTEGDYIQIPFRMLSAILIPGEWVDFSTDGLLEGSVNKFNNLTIFPDHRPNIERWIGVAINARFSNSKGISGIDADFKIDKVKSPEVAKGLTMDPPAIKHCSVALSYKYRQSHPEMDKWDFYSYMGKKVGNEIVREIAEKIIQVTEVSLVYAGADPYAKRLSFNGYSFIDRDENENKGEIMDKEMELQIKKISSENEELKKKILILEEKNTDLEARNLEVLALAELGKESLQSLRGETEKNYRLCFEDKIEDSMLNLIKEGDIEIVKSFNLSYKQMAEKLHPMQNGTRQSSVESNGNTSKKLSTETSKDIEFYANM